MTVTRSTLVFIHGFLDGAAAWADVVAELGDRAGDALCIDLPGMGNRVGEPGPYSLDKFAEDIATSARTLGRPVVLVGHSMGAQVAELAAGRLGDQVRAMVLLTPVPLQGTGLPADAMAAFHSLGGNPGAQRDMRRHLQSGTRWRQARDAEPARRWCRGRLRRRARRHLEPRARNGCAAHAGHGPDLAG